ncbi:MAG TPA: NPCBM/NEW2 domain-containing protein [Planctomycetaceae bacterium]|nr:NPCBM/NEW2 domain-containing protein [Planctomycetaceae bacterium]
MNLAATILALVLVQAAPPQVEVSTLSGESHQGELVRLDGKTVSLKKGESTVDVPLADVMAVRLPAPADEQPADPALARVRLVDGTSLACTGLSADSRSASLQTARLGEVAVPLSAVASVRLGALDSKVADAWTELRSRATQRDLLVIRKNDVLDHLAGVVGAIDGENVKFLLGGREVPVKRANVFGIVYSRREGDRKSPACEATLVGEDVAQLKGVTFENGAFAAELLAGPKVALQAADVRVLDFSLGKVRYLSDLEPREYVLTPFFDGEAERSLFRYRRDRNQTGGPIAVGGRAYAKGLWIHSRTKLVYRIGGEYRRFQAVMGIDDDVAPRGDVHVVIKGDGKVLLEADVRGPDKPRELDLDVSGVRDLEIFVDYGSGLDISDHLDLAEARVLK